MMRKLIWLTVGMCLALPLAAQSRMISHVTRAGGGFTTSVIVENQSAVSQNVTLQPYDANGNALTVLEMTIDGGSALNQSSQTLFADGDQVSHFSIDADSSVAVSVAYDFDAGNGSPAHVASRADQGSMWRLFPGNWDNVFDGIAVVNNGDRPADIWVSQRDLDGNYIRSERAAASLAPNAKALYVIGSPGGSSFSRDTASYFEVSSDSSLSITALRGTLADAPVGLLWSNDSRAMSTSSSKRNDQSIWFIKNGSLSNVIEMMGYQVARDRLWQMEVNRRSATGKLSEIFGSSLITGDAFVLSQNYSPDEITAYYNALDDENKTILNAYVDGINRRISQVNSDQDILPIEFKIVNMFEIPAWTVADVMYYMSFAQRNFSMEGWGIAQIENVSIAQAMIEQSASIAEAAARFDDLRWVNDPLALTMVPLQAPKRLPEVKRDPNPGEGWQLREGLVDIAKRARHTVDTYKGVMQEKGINTKMGSYAWVISGDRTESGNPIMYAGPQMSPTAPAPIVEGSIESDALTVSGMVIPGIPAVLVGRTPHHVWSFQVGHTHTWDYYVEDQADVTLDRIETIKVAGAADVDIHLYRSEHGPIMYRANTGALDPSEGPQIAFKYSQWGHEFDLSGGIMKLAKAQSMEEFGEGVDQLGLTQHILYADVDGNIAYWLSGRNPVRPEGNYRMPQGAVLDPVEYDSDVLQPTVHDANPARGWYGGWNMKARPDVADPTATYHYGIYNRSHMIQEWLAETDNMTFEQARDFVFQVASTWNTSWGGNEWPFIGPYFASVVEEQGTEEQKAALEVINNWDGTMVVEEGDLFNSVSGDPGWHAYRLWIIQTFRVIFDETDPFFLVTTPNSRVNMFNSMLNTTLQMLSPDAVTKPQFDWYINNTDPDAPQTFEECVLLGLDNAIEILNEDPVWGISARGIKSYQHALFDELHSQPFWNNSIYGQCVEIGPNGPIRIETTFPLGQSGTILADENNNPVTEKGNSIFSLTPDLTDDPFINMAPLYDFFIHNPFPLFGEDID